MPDTLPSGHRVDPNMKILFSLYAMGRMKFIWGEDCTEFKPEKWLSERGMIKHEPSYKFLSFNAGPRTCLGRKVAFTQLKVVVASTIHNYNVQVVEGHTVAPNVSIILINYQILDRGSYGEDHFTAEFGTVCSPCFRHILEVLDSSHCILGGWRR
ncbi:hypothetical protein CsSME_00002830 [Camellia sinensis var. sinensis]